MGILIIIGGDTNRLVQICVLNWLFLPFEIGEILFVTATEITLTQTIGTLSVCKACSLSPNGIR